MSLSSSSLNNDDDDDDDTYDDDDDMMPTPPAMMTFASTGGASGSLGGNTTLSSNTFGSSPHNNSIGSNIGNNTTQNNSNINNNINNNNINNNINNNDNTSNFSRDSLFTKKDVIAIKGFRLSAPQVDDEPEVWGEQSEEQQPSQPFILPDEPLPLMSPGANKVTRPSVTANSWGTLVAPGASTTMFPSTRSFLSANNNNNGNGDPNQNSYTNNSSTRSFLNDQRPEDFIVRKNSRRASDFNGMGGGGGMDGDASIRSAELRAIQNMPVNFHSETDSRFSASGRNSLVQVRLENWSSRSGEEMHPVYPGGGGQLRGISGGQKAVLYCLAITIILLFLGVIVGVIIALQQESTDPLLSSGTVPTVPPVTSAQPVATALPTVMPSSAPTMLPSILPSAIPTKPVILNTLERIVLEGRLNCGVVEAIGFAVQAGGVWTGMDIDMCRAVAGAALGDSNSVRFIRLEPSERFAALNRKDIDVLAGLTTFTMERNVHEPTTETGYTFSTPYLYDGLGFGGIPEFLECVENRNVTGTVCSELQICLVDGTTQMSVVQKHFAPLSISDRIVAVGNIAGVYEGFKSGFCNVIASDQFSIARTTLFANGYSGGAYEVGTDVYSNEPLALVTRDADPQFSDFVNWVVISLLHAEERNIRSANAAAMGSIGDLFGPLHEFAFADAVQAVGNYGEIYDRNLEGIVSRQAINEINRGGSGLIYHLPFGNVLSVGPSAQGTLADILSRGFLRCGITRRAIFAEFDTASQGWHGIDIDMCRAVSAAIFDGIYSTIVFVDLPATERFRALQNGDVDLLSRITTLTLERDVLEPTTGVGFDFTSPLFYDGLTFGGVPELLQCAIDRNIVSAVCQDLRVCVNQGTTYINILREILPERVLVPRISGSQTIEGLGTGECNVVAGGVVDVSLRNLEATGYTGPYELATGAPLSKDPIALVTRQGDPQWSKFVFWTLHALFYAEAEGITRDTSTRMPVVNLFGQLNFRIFRDAIASVGSFQEIYEREAEASIPRSGLNLLNSNPFGPQHYVYPGLQ